MVSPRLMEEKMSLYLEQACSREGCVDAPHYVKATIPEVVAWLREQGAIEADVDEDGYWTRPAVKTIVDYVTENEPRISIYHKPGRYLVVPVDVRVEGEEEQRGGMK